MVGLLLTIENSCASRVGVVKLTGRAADYV